MSAEVAEEIIIICITAFAMPDDPFNGTSREELESFVVEMESSSDWPNLRRLFRLAKEGVYPQLQKYTFSEAEHILNIVVHSLRAEGQCRELKDQLVLLQDEGHVGRARLSTIYRASLETREVDFGESLEYLRQQGALDESDPMNPLVIIPNYLGLRSNCMNTSIYFDECCVDLCEDLMDVLEREFQAPQASPEKIMQVLGAMATEYVPAGRSWSRELRQKLEEVAEYHGGEVPLHGRLFAQWMHFAYPMQCAYPHMSGSIKMASFAEWREATGLEPRATEEEMIQLLSMTDSGIRNSPCKDSEEGMCMWNPKEELVDAVNWGTRHSPRRSADSAGSAGVGKFQWLSMIALVGVVFSSASSFRTYLAQVGHAWRLYSAGALPFLGTRSKKDQELCV
jgi:hypothetical protein